MNITLTQRKEHVCKKLIEVFGILTRCPRLASFGQPLLHMASTTLTTPVTEITDRVFHQTSPLPDAFVSMSDFAKLTNRMRRGITYLDHIGFLYATDSQEQELERIRKAATNMNLYEMTSNDEAKWYFVGDATHWQDPMVELLPVVPVPSRHVQPHIHIDIETRFSADEIEKFLTDVFGNTRKPKRCFDPSYGDYSVNLWLGSVSGINIFLDMSTKINNLKWIRSHMLRRI